MEKSCFVKELKQEKGLVSGSRRINYVSCLQLDTESRKFNCINIPSFRLDRGLSTGSLLSEKEPKV